MKKKLLITVIALVCSVCCVAMLFAGCKDNKPGTQEYDISEIAKEGGAWYQKFELSFGVPKSVSVDGGKTYASMNVSDTYSSGYFSIKSQYKSADYELVNIKIKIRSAQTCEKTITVAPWIDSFKCNAFYTKTVAFNAGEEKEIVFEINKPINEFVEISTGLVQVFFHKLKETSEYSASIMCNDIKYSIDKSDWDMAISIPEIKFTITKK